MYVSAEEKDVTTRLVLMDMKDHEGFRIFAGRMREELPDITMVDLQFYYRKYRGWDWLHPTHDIETGKALR